MTSRLIWQNAQHQILFELLDTINRGEGDGRVLEHLAAYADSHFSLEETYMRKLNYPGMDAHIQAHEKFRKELLTLVAMQNNYDAEIAKSLSLFLTEWLKRHIFGIDKKLEAFILASEYK